MTARDCFELLTHKIHTVIAATSDGGDPVTCAIDIMDCDDGGLYFLTAKSKNFYRRLKARPTISLTGVCGRNTMSSVAITARGKVREIGESAVPRLFQKNRYMYEIYPDARSQSALSAFYICEGSIDVFDLSVKPIETRHIEW